MQNTFLKGNEKMKHKKIRCLITIPIIEDAKPCYRWRFNNKELLGMLLDERKKDCKYA